MQNTFLLLRYVYQLNSITNIHILLEIKMSQNVYFNIYTNITCIYLLDRMFLLCILGSYMNPMYDITWLYISHNSCINTPSSDKLFYLALHSEEGCFPGQSYCNCFHQTLCGMWRQLTKGSHRCCGTLLIM